jgi:hypothetical protein
MDYQIFNVEHAQQLTKESDGLFESLINDCWKEIKEQCSKGKFLLQYEYSAIYEAQIERFVKLLNDAGYSAKTCNHRTVVIRWELSMEELASDPVIKEGQS